MSSSSPQVGILMGSASDLEVVSKAAQVFKKFGVPYEMRVLSAHRLPQEVAQYASQAESQGMKVLIGAAGMAAHLCGALAAHSTLPVIGIPLTSGKSGVAGLDALLATVQMPKGIPVASVAIDGAENAAYLAIQILGLSDPSLAQKYKAERLDNAKKILATKIDE